MPSLILNGNKIGGTVDDSAFLRYSNENSTLQASTIQDAVTELDEKVEASKVYTDEKISEVSGKADTDFTDAKAYTDEKMLEVKNDLLNGAGAAYDTLKELGDLIDENHDAIDVLENLVSKTKFIKDNQNSTIDSIDNLKGEAAGGYWIQSNLSAGTHPFGDADNIAFYYLVVLNELRGCVQIAFGYNDGRIKSRTWVNGQWYQWTTDYLPLTGGKMTGSINIADKLWLKADGEGGNVRFTSKDGLHHWEMDANGNNSFRLYHGTNNGHANGAAEADSMFTFTDAGAITSKAGAFLNMSDAYNATSVTSTNHNSSTSQKQVPTMSFVSYWNGAYNTSGSSNLAYCSKGAFGTAAAKNVDTTPTTSSTNLITSGGAKAALDTKMNKSRISLEVNKDFSTSSQTYTNTTYLKNSNAIVHAVIACTTSSYSRVIPLTPLLYSGAQCIGLSVQYTCNLLVFWDTNNGRISFNAETVGYDADAWTLKRLDIWV